MLRAAARRRRRADGRGADARPLQRLCRGRPRLPAGHVSLVEPPGGLLAEPAIKWTRLAVLETADGGLFDSAGTVRFRAVHVREGSAASWTRRADSSGRTGGGATSAPLTDAPLTDAGRLAAGRLDLADDGPGPGEGAVFAQPQRRLPVGQPTEFGQRGGPPDGQPGLLEQVRVSARRPVVDGVGIRGSRRCRATCLTRRRWSSRRDRPARGPPARSRPRASACCCTARRGPVARAAGRAAGGCGCALPTRFRAAATSASWVRVSIRPGADCRMSESCSQPVVTNRVAVKP